MKYPWLSPHIDARHGNSTEETLLINLVYGTRILCDDDSWEKLGKVAKGEADLDDPWLKRAEAAFLLQSETPRPWPNFVTRFEKETRKFLEKQTGLKQEPATNRVQLLKRLDAVEVEYHRTSMPTPYVGPEENVGPLMLKPSRMVDFMFDHTRAFLEQDLEDESRDLTFDLVEQFFDRPALKLRYEQQFCIPRTTQLRAEMILERSDPGARILVMGDDDLVALALVEFSDDVQVDVLELDTDLVAFLKEKGRGRFTVLEHDLKTGMPDAMKACYDAVTTDPPYADDGMRFFLECAKASLKNHEKSRLYLTTFPGLLESPEKLWADLDELNFEILKTHDHFSRYIYNNTYRVQHLAALKYLGAPLHPTTELLGFPFLYAHFFECQPH